MRGLGQPGEEDTIDRSSAGRIWFVRALQIAATAAVVVGIIKMARYLGGGDIGDPCHDRLGCSGDLVCAAGACRPQCEREPDCPEHWSCEDPARWTRRLARSARAPSRVCVSPLEWFGRPLEAPRESLEPKMKRARPLDEHRDRIRGLHLYGALVYRPSWSHFETVWRSVSSRDERTDKELIHALQHRLSAKRR
ncbi:MAG: hypothetical protein AAF735_04380 [Myxococcota bacterium]